MEDQRQVYHLPWLDSCLEETLLPGKPWHKVYDRLGRALAHEFLLRNSPQSRRSLELLGGHFLQAFLPSLVHDQIRQSAAVEETAAEELDVLCERAAERCQCQWKSDGSHAGVCQEMMDFVNDTHNLVASEMEQILALEERKRREEAELGPVELDSAWALVARGRPLSVESRDLHLTMHRNRAHNTTGPRSQFSSPPPPPLHCVESEVLGGALSAVLTSDPSRMQAVCERLGGQLLPASLRRSVWIEKLLKPEALKSSTTWALERRARERFGRTVERRVAVLKLRSATRSPISGLIENAVVEIYEQTPCMQAFASSEQMISESCKALNVLYVHSQVYQPRLVLWLFPLQIAFQQRTAKAEHSYELAMYLDLLLEGFLPGQAEIAAMAESVMRRVEEQDPDLSSHLRSCCSRNHILNPKDYAVELLSQEREKALEALDVTCPGDRHVADTKELLENPGIFLRKWIGEGFVSVLDLPAVLLVWDQLFMQVWNRRVMEDVCLALLMLLREALMAACDYQSVREVLSGHVNHLFTADIQRAWIHLQHGGRAADIPGFNRLDTRLLYGPFPEETAPHDSATRPLGEILPLGLRDVAISLILDLPNEGDLHQAWGKSFDPHAVSLTASVAWGNVNLCSKSTLLKPLVEERTPRRETTSEYEICYSDILLFDSLDLSDFREACSVKDTPAVIFEVVHSSDGNGLAPVTLGWARADLLVEQRAGSRSVLAPVELTSHVPILPGLVQDLPLGCSPSHSSTGLLLRGSEIHVTSFNPAKETHGPESSQSKTECLPSSEEPPFLYPPWVPHDPTLAVPHTATVHHPLDLYIDALHYIPDSATIVKVTGRFLRSGTEDLPDIMAFPDLSSSARSPEFHFRTTVNPGHQTPFDPSMLLLLRVYTISADGKELSVIGNCVVRLFDNTGRLNAGGHQLRLRGGMPPKESGPLTESSLCHYPTIPCSSLLIRILPHTPEFLQAPAYHSGFYFTDKAKPSQSELRIISTFQNNRHFPETVEAMVQELAEKKRVPPEQVPVWYEDRLDSRKQSHPQHPPMHLSPLRVVRYQQRAGIRVRVAQAFGLPDGLYVNAFSRVLKGAERGGHEKFRVVPPAESPPLD
ncbi:hypothetical protein MATL_G00123060 [Megalops atlanticus]|uniref:Uncharacterized protein n=1 Tax=Megalops atlanticus TaxID=7932 RepID=A0A9D3T553_MEGAT|nr:hypothetical protein MATL_G00123060 [Megalops atlanticus]